MLGLFVDPAGEAPLTALWESFTGSSLTYDQVVDRTKHLVLDRVLVAEVDRLTEVGLAVCRQDPTLRDTTRRVLHEALVELLASFGVYRAYLPPDGPADQVARDHVERAVAHASGRVPERAPQIALAGRLALAQGPSGPAAREFVTRFQQTCGPVMAKGVEDTAFYRYLRLSALNEVGGDPGRFGLPVEAFHDACVAQQEQWPVAQTTLSTHDTKRAEDVRARLVLLAQCPVQWGEAVVRWSALAAGHRSPAGPDRATEYLLWQSLLGAWPISADRAAAYVEKATREAKAQTSWVDPVPEFDQAVQAYVRAVLADPAITGELADFAAGLDDAWQSTLLAQKLVQLTMPGVADTYQGTELTDPVAGRPGQPSPGRLRRAPAGPCGPGVRAGQAAADGDHAAAAPRAPVLVPDRRDVPAAAGRRAGSGVLPVRPGGDRRADPDRRRTAYRLGAGRRGAARGPMARPAGWPGVVGADLAGRAARRRAPRCSCAPDRGTLVR